MTHARMSIRPATAGDAGAIAELHVEGWRWAYREHMPAALLDGLSVERRATMWRDLLATPDTQARIWLAERDGRMIGFSATGLPQDAGAPPLTAQLLAIYLRNSQS